MSDRDEFEKWANQFNHDSGRWEDMGRDEVFIAGMKAARQGGEAEPVAWVSPLVHGQQVTFYKPTEPKGWEDDELGKEWYCRPLIYADAHPPATTQGVPERVLKALRFYEEKARLCRKITDEGEEARAALDKDGGESARFALSYAEAAQNHPGGEWLRRSEIRDRLFSGWQGCSNHDCIITGPKKGMGTNGSCGCLHNASRTQLSILKARIQSMMEPPKDKQEGA